VETDGRTDGRAASAIAQVRVLCEIDVDTMMKEKERNRKKRRRKTSEKALGGSKALISHRNV